MFNDFQHSWLCGVYLMSPDLYNTVDCDVFTSCQLSISTWLTARCLFTWCWLTTSTQLTMVFTWCWPTISTQLTVIIYLKDVYWLFLHSWQMLTDYFLHSWLWSVYLMSTDYFYTVVFEAGLRKSDKMPVMDSYQFSWRKMTILSKNSMRPVKSYCKVWQCFVLFSPTQ